jgi:hypothetical protein
MDNNPEELFVKYHTTLRDKLNNAYWHYQTYKYIQEAKDSYLKELNQAPAFFQLTINAHLHRSLVLINLLFGQTEEHLHVRSFLDFVEENIDIFSLDRFSERLKKSGRYAIFDLEERSIVTVEKIADHRKIINDLPLSNLRNWRNSILSHLAKKYIESEVDVVYRYPIKHEHIEIIIKSIDDILNFYSEAFEGSVWEKDISITHGITLILETIKKDILNRSFEFEAIRSKISKRKD